MLCGHWGEGVNARSRLFRLAGYARPLAPLLLAASCQLQTYSVPVPPTGVVDIGRVAEAFQDICLGTAPTFRAARERFARHGLVKGRRDGIVFDGSGTLSVRVDSVRTSRGPKRRCSMVYQDPNRFIVEERIDRMLRSAPGRVRGKRAARFPASGGGLRDGRAWSYATGGRTGDLLDLPFAGGADLGVLILQFPSLR